MMSDVDLGFFFEPSIERHVSPIIPIHVEVNMI